MEVINSQNSTRMLNSSPPLKLDTTGPVKEAEEEDSQTQELDNTTPKVQMKKTLRQIKLERIKQRQEQRQTKIKDQINRYEPINMKKINLKIQPNNEVLTILRSMGS